MVGGGFVVVLVLVARAAKVRNAIPPAAVAVALLDWWSWLRDLLEHRPSVYWRAWLRVVLIEVGLVV